MTDPKPKDDLFQANLKALEKLFPQDMLSSIREHQPTRYLVDAPPEQGALNEPADDANGLGYLKDGQFVYDCDARIASNLAVDAFVKQPRRIYIPPFPPKQPETMPYWHFKFATELDRSIGPILEVDSLHPPTKGGGSLVVLGFGLGLSITPLIEALQFRNLIISIEHPDSLWWSLHLLPWGEILDEITRRNGVVHIAFFSDARSNATQILASLRMQNLALNDGSYLFVDPAFPEMAELADNIDAASGILHGTAGFFEDEILMLKNAFGNLKKPSHWTYPGAQQVSRKTSLPPALIVGNGPSLDGDLEKIKGNVEKFVVFAAGTAEHTLQKHSVRSFFHCYLENNLFYQKQLDKDIKSGFLSFPKTLLISPYTVSPDLSRHFRGALFYHRELLVPTRLWATQQHVLMHTAPTVANLAAAAAASLGFNKIVLVGVDLGSKHEASMHASGGYYDRNDDWIETYPLKTTTEGNFGDLVRTNSIFQMSKQNLEALAASRPDITWLNASDGAALNGFRPVKFANVCDELKDIDRAGLEEHLLSSWGMSKGGVHHVSDTLQAFLTGATKHLADIKAVLDEVLRNPLATPEMFHDAASDYLVPSYCDTRHTLDAAISAMFSGTILAAIRHGVYYEKRIQTQNRDAFFREYWKAMNLLLSSMEEELESEFSSIIDNLD